MEEFKIGETVRITGKVMNGLVGTVVHFDQKRDKILVRMGGETQNYYSADELETFSG